MNLPVDDIRVRRDTFGLMKRIAPASRRRTWPLGAGIATALLVTAGSAGAQCAPTGLYLGRLQAGDAVVTRRLLCVR